MNKIKLFMLTLLVMLAVVPQAKAKYVNPISDIDAADPSVILADDGYYYMYCSESYSGEGIPVWRSADMINWTKITNIFATRPVGVNYTFLWAPEIAKIGDKYVLYYANAEYGDQNSTQICVATSNKPYGPFENNKILIKCRINKILTFEQTGTRYDDIAKGEIAEKNIIDPSLFCDIDANGNSHNYLVWGSWHGVWYIELDASGTNLKSGTSRRALVSGTSGDWNKIEAPMVVKHTAADDGKTYYYLICSKGTTVNASDVNGIDYRLVVARGETLGGVFHTKDNDNSFSRSGRTMMGILENGDYARGPGHCSHLVKDPNGVEWVFYHGYSKKSDGNWNYPGPRKVYASKVEWDRWFTGWPGIMPPNMDPLDCPTIDPLGVYGDEVKEIYNASDLKKFADYVNSGHVYATAILMNDINMSGVNYTPIGTSEHMFQGVIDGQGYRIQNLVINTNAPNQGLVAYATGGAQFKYIIIDSSCSFTGGDHTAAFLGYVTGSGTIQFYCCGNEANVIGDQNTAGFVGCVNNDCNVQVYIDNCYNMGNINTDQHQGSESAAFSGWKLHRLRNSWNTGRTMGCSGAGDGKWYSLARGLDNANSINSFDLNLNNAPLDNHRLANYDSSWMANGHLTYAINQGAGMDVWYQNIDEDVTPKDAHPVFLSSHLPVIFENGNYKNKKGSLIVKSRDTSNGNYGTFCLEYPTVATTGAIFYNIIAERDDYSALVLEKVSDDEQQHLKAGKSYIFKPTGDNMTYSYYADAAPSSAIISAGLVGNVIKNSMQVMPGNYILKNNKFVKVPEGQDAFIAINRAYILNEDKRHLKDVYDIENASSRSLVYFGFDGNIEEDDDSPTEIDLIIKDAEDDAIYNIAGQRVGEDYRGIIIKNGKKYLRK